MTSLEGETREIQDLAARIIGPLTGLGQRNEGPLVGGGIECHQLDVRQGRETAGAVENTSVGRPSDHNRLSALEGVALRWTTHHRHRVDFTGSFIGGAEGDRLAVRRNGGLVLLGRMGGQTLSHATLDPHSPKIPLGSENDGVSMDCRIAEVAPRSRLSTLCKRRPREQEKLEKQGWNQSSSRHRGSLCPHTSRCNPGLPVTLSLPAGFRTERRHATTQGSAGKLFIIEE